MDDKLHRPVSSSDPTPTGQSLQPFPRTAYQQVQQSAPVDTPATLPHIGGVPPIGQPPRKSSAKTALMIIVTLLMLMAVGVAAVFYVQMGDAKRQADDALRQVDKLKSENNRLKKDIASEPATDVTDNSAVYGKLFYKMLSSYAPIAGAAINLSSAEIEADRIAIEKAYKEHYKLPDTAEPLKNKEIEIMTIYKEGDTTRALVYGAATADDPPSFMPFVREGTTWKYAAPVVDGN